jgi:hypothetical protein
MRKAALLKLINFWPPYFGAGVRVTKISADMREIDVEMKLKFWNRNYVGTQFGGSLYSMVDPFYMLMLIENLGRDYIVWDKAASIRFRKPGQGRVRARFRLNSAQIDEIKSQADSEDKYEPRFQVQILDDSGDVIAEVEKILYVRRKDKVKPRS